MLPPRIEAGASRPRQLKWKPFLLLPGSCFIWDSCLVFAGRSVFPINIWYHILAHILTSHYACFSRIIQFSFDLWNALFTSYKIIKLDKNPHKRIDLQGSLKTCFHPHQEIAAERYRFYPFTAYLSWWRKTCSLWNSLLFAANGHICIDIHVREYS